MSVGCTSASLNLLDSSNAWAIWSAAARVYHQDWESRPQYDHRTWTSLMLSEALNQGGHISDVCYEPTRALRSSSAGPTPAAQRWWSSFYVRHTSGTNLQNMWGLPQHCSLLNQGSKHFVLQQLLIKCVYWHYIYSLNILYIYII